MTTPDRRGRIQPPNLDDRTWQDLVDEMTALIDVYAPQWTDRTPSDLGMTLIELFAALGEGVLYRLNQVPDKNYLAMLDLLGVKRDPASPAQTYLTFTTSTGVVTVPAGTQAQTQTVERENPVDDMICTRLVSRVEIAGFGRRLERAHDHPRGIGTQIKRLPVQEGGL